MRGSRDKMTVRDTEYLQFEGGEKKGKPPLTTKKKKRGGGRIEGLTGWSTYLRRSTGGTPIHICVFLFCLVHDS